MSLWSPEAGTCQFHMQSIIAHFLRKSLFLEFLTMGQQCIMSWVYQTHQVIMLNWSNSSLSSDGYCTSEREPKQDQRAQHAAQASSPDLHVINYSCLHPSLGLHLWPVGILYDQEKGQEKI